MRLRPCYLCHGAKLLDNHACPACSSPRRWAFGGMVFMVERDVIGEGFTLEPDETERGAFDAVKGE